MNLPHQIPIRFVESIINTSENCNIINCKFPYIPTLAMVCEAAAQSSASFIENSENPILGFLISLKNIKQTYKFTKNTYKIKIEKSFNFGTMSEFKFELFDELNIYAIGELTIAIQN